MYDNIDQYLDPPTREHNGIIVQSIPYDSLCQVVSQQLLVWCGLLQELDGLEFLLVLERTYDSNVYW